MKTIRTHNQTLFTLPGLALTLIVLAACGSDHGGHDGHDHDHDHEHDHHSHSEHASPESTFVAGKGVQLSEPGKTSLGVEIEPVRVQNVQNMLSLKAQVYRQSNESPRSNGTTRPGFAYASVFHNANTADALTIGTEGTAEHGAESFPSRVVEIDRQLADTTGQVEYLIEMRDPESRLDLGEFVEVTFPTATKGRDDKSLVMIPESAVLRTARGDFAFAENQGYLFRAPIQVVRVKNNQALISDGLYEGDFVAANRVENLYMIELQVTNGGKGCAHGH